MNLQHLYQCPLFVYLPSFVSTFDNSTLCPPCHVFVYNWANTRKSVLKKLDFFQLRVWKRAVRLPHEIISFCRKKVRQKYQNFIGGTPTNWVKFSFDHQKNQKSNIILEGSRHPNFKNPFECGKLFHYKSFPIRLGTPTPLNPKIFRGGTTCPPPRPPSIDMLK